MWSKATPRPLVTSESDCSSVSGLRWVMAIVMPMTVPNRPRIGIAQIMIRIERVVGVHSHRILFFQIAEMLFDRVGRVLAADHFQRLAEAAQQAIVWLRFRLRVELGGKLLTGRDGYAADRNETERDIADRCELRDDIDKPHRQRREPDEEHHADHVLDAVARHVLLKKRNYRASQCGVRHRMRARPRRPTRQAVSGSIR